MEADSIFGLARGGGDEIDSLINFWLLFILGGIRMVAVHSKWHLDSYCLLLVVSGWLLFMPGVSACLLFKSGSIWGVTIHSWWSGNGS